MFGSLKHDCAWCGFCSADVRAPVLPHSRGSFGSGSAPATRRL